MPEIFTANALFSDQGTIRAEDDTNLVWAIDADNVMAVPLFMDHYSYKFLNF
jgi:hypothetical protein